MSWIFVLATAISISVYLSQIVGVFDSPRAFYIINYFSNESDVGFENNISVPPEFRSETDILIPANFTGQQVQVRVELRFFMQQEVSAPLTVGKTY